MDQRLGATPREVLSGGQIRYTYELLKANVVRSRRTMSFVLVSCKAGGDTAELGERLRSGIRQTDVVFDTGLPGVFGLLLPQSGKEEAAAFLRRFALIFRDECEIRAAILAVQHPDLPFERALELTAEELQKEDGLLSLADSELGRQEETVKVSVLDPDPLFRDALTLAVTELRVPSISLDVRSFGDGLELLESDWTSSWHPHLVVLNDVLPKQNGLDVLHALRSMPNEQKFTVLMMTRRNSEEDIIYAYESGADGYLVKPFNLRLFEAQVKRLLAGLWT